MKGTMIDVKSKRWMRWKRRRNKKVGGSEWGSWGSCWGWSQAQTYEGRAWLGPLDAKWLVHSREESADPQAPAGLNPCPGFP